MQLTKIKLGETSTIDTSKDERGWVDSGRVINLKEALELLKDCEHEKVYSNTILYSMPSLHPWICRKCGKKGQDRSEMALIDEYETIKEKFRKRVK